MTNKVDKHLFLSKFLDCYLNQRSCHLKRVWLEPTPIFKRIFNYKDIFTKLLFQDIERLSFLPEIVHHHISNESMTINDIREVIFFLKMEQSILDDRYYFLIRLFGIFSVLAGAFLVGTGNQLFVAKIVTSIFLIAVLLEAVFNKQKSAIYNELAMAFEYWVNAQKVN